jgi:AP-1 complex subunit mu
VEYLIKAKSQFKPKSYANNLEIFIPVPGDVDRPAFKASVGTVTYVPDLDAIKWTIKQVCSAQLFSWRNIPFAT